MREEAARTQLPGYASPAGGSSEAPNGRSAAGNPARRPISDGCRPGRVTAFGTSSGGAVASSSVARRKVLTRPGPTRLARVSGVIRRGAEGSPVLEGDGSDIPIVITAAHTLLLEGEALLADANGTPVVWEGDRVELVGGFAPEGGAFYATAVTVVDDE
jgi:hypothetical protein